MLINHDYSYTDKALIDAGYATIGLHSLVFNRHFTEEEMENNREFANTFGMNSPEWAKRCDDTGQKICSQLEKVMDVINSEYTVCQYKNETVKYGEHDLFFYSNKGWNKKEWYDYMTLSFNDKRTTESHFLLLDDILPTLSEIDCQNISCKIQYKTIVKEEKLCKDALEVCKKLEGKMINYMGREGKIKLISDGEYGFFKKGAKTHYYNIDKQYIVLNLVG